MISGINVADIEYELLTEYNYDNAFDCSIDDELRLNEFYHTEAIDFQNERLDHIPVYLS